MPRLRTDFRQPRGPAPDAEATAIAALGYLAAHPGLLERLFALSGMAPGDLAAAAGDPDTLGAVLDFVLADEPVLLAFCEDAGLAPESVMRARAALPGAPVWE